MSARKRSTFTLGSTRTSNVEVKTSPSRDQRFGSEIIVTKGADGQNIFQIEIDKIRDRLARLRACHKRSIRALTGKEHEDFQAMTYYVQLLYDTNQYPVLYKHIQEHFRDLDEMHPGSVGAYFGGCLVSPGTTENPGCVLHCAGGVPPPSGNGFQPCDKLVIWAIWDGKSYTLTPVNAATVTDNTQAYLYVEVASLAAFPGLSESEKASLTRLGIQSVKLVRYTTDGTAPVDLTPDFIPLAQIKTRGLVPPSPGPVPPVPGPVPPVPGPVPPAPAPERRDNTWMIILLVALLLLILFLGWRAWSGNRDQGSTLMAAAPATLITPTLQQGPTVAIPGTAVGPATIL